MSKKEREKGLAFALVWLLIVIGGVILVSVTQIKGLALLWFLASDAAPAVIEESAPDRESGRYFASPERLAMAVSIQEQLRGRRDLIPGLHGPHPGAAESAVSVQERGSLFSSDGNGVKADVLYHTDFTVDTGSDSKGWIFSSTSGWIQNKDCLTDQSTLPKEAVMGGMTLNCNNQRTPTVSAARTLGSATSPRIELKGTSQVVIVFACAYLTDDGDRRSFAILRDGEKRPFCEVPVSPLTAGPSGLACSSANLWHLHVLPVEASGEAIRVRFDYETSGRIGGWFIDELSVHAVPAGGTEPSVRSEVFRRGN